MRYEEIAMNFMQVDVKFLKKSPKNHIFHNKKINLHYNGIMKSLRIRITVVSMLVVLVSNFIIGWVSITSSKNSLRSQQEQSLTESVYATAESIKASNEKEFKMLETLAAIPEIRDPEVSLLEKAHIIYGAMSLDKDYIDVAILDTDGNSWINNGERIISFAERDYYQQPLKTGRRFVTDPFINKVTNAMAIFYSVPVFDADNNIINVLFCVIDGFKLSDLATGHKAGDDRPSFMISLNTGLTIASENHDAVAAENLFENAAESGNQQYLAAYSKINTGETGVAMYSLDKETYICAFEKVPDTNWMTVNAVPYSDFQGDIDKTQSRIIFFVVMFSLISIVVVFFAISHSINPLGKVRDAITEISTGNADLTRRIPISSEDEIGAVVKGFNQFAEKLQGIIYGIKQSRLQLLQAGSRMNMNAEQTADNINSVYASIEDMQNIIVTQTDSVENTAQTVRQVAAKITELEKKQELVNVKIQEIADQSKTLQGANHVIAMIASQTNLLAINAAIEASHAGEVGRGFNVVAEEIKKLAENSAKESAKITEEIKQIMASVADVVESASESKEAFNNVSALIESSQATARHGNADPETEGSQPVLDEVSKLQTVTSTMKEIMRKISNGADLINRSGNELGEIAPQLKSTIDVISEQIDLFKV